MEPVSDLQEIGDRILHGDTVTEVEARAYAEHVTANMEGHGLLPCRKHGGTTRHTVDFALCDCLRKDGDQ